MHPESAVQVSLVTADDLADLLPLMRAYCTFYESDPSDDDPWCDAQTADPEAGCAPNVLGCFATAATPALPAGPK